ncbi:unnamed protein product [Jaminaea pallidilutea]
MSSHHDNAVAELELLAQNQKKLDQLTQRMTRILSGFDRRLANLEGTLLPIHHRTQTLQRVDKNVSATLEALKHTLGHFDVVQDEEPKILDGPRTASEAGPYFDTIDRLVRGLEYLKRSDLKSQEDVIRRMYSLIETGSRNLTSLLSDSVSAESSPISPEDFLPRRVPLPILSGSTIEAITPIFSHLKSLPMNPANGYAPFLASLSVYSDVRGTYLEQSVAASGRQLVDFCKEVVGVSSIGQGSSLNAALASEEEETYQRGSSGAREWMQSMLDMAENELAILTNLLRGLQPPSSSNTISSTFARMLKPMLRHFHLTIAAAHGHIRQHISTHTLFALDLIAVLTQFQSRWDNVVVRGSSRNPGDGEADMDNGSVQALSEHLQSLRSSMINVFPTLLNDLQAIPRMRSGEVPSTHTNEITYAGVSLIRSMIDYSDIVPSLLSLLGAGNWKMGGSSAPVLSLSGDSKAILSQYLCDALATTLEALQARSKAIQQPSTASIFLLNNMGRLQQDLNSSSAIQKYMQPEGNEILAKALIDSRKAYLDAWSPVVTAIKDDSIPGSSRHGGGKLGGGVLGGSGERAQKEDAKQRFARFFESLDDLERLHAAYPLGREFDELRSSLQKDVVRLVLPLYSRFVAKQMAAHFSSNPSKHLKPEAEVEERLNHIFA